MINLHFVVFLQLLARLKAVNINLPTHLPKFCCWSETSLKRGSLLVMPPNIVLKMANTLAKTHDNILMDSSELGEMEQMRKN
jgi:hypothetical protein